MASDWNEYKIDDLKAPVKGSIAMGPFGSRIKAENFVTEGVPIIKGGQLHGAYVLDSGFDFLTPEKAEELKSSQAYRGDLVITHRGTIGQVSIIPHDSLYEKYIVSQSQLKVSFDKTKVNPYFVNYFFRSHLGQHRLLANASQVGVPAIAKASTSVKAIMIPCPSLEEQNKVVGYLKNLDDKIELNRQMNETLEAMAQALFKSWFVDFDPVIDNALAAGNDIPDELLERAEQRKAIEKKDNSNIQDLFPNEFEFTEEMGWIPRGWESGTLADICFFGKGKINTSELSLENYVSTENMNKEKAGISYAASIASTSQVPKFSVGQTLISNIRPYFKKIWLASFSGGRSNDVLGFQANDAVANEYLFSLLYQDSFFDYITATSKGTKMPRGDKAAIMSWSVAIPPLILVEEFSNKVKPMYLANNIRSKQAISLSELRDTLLPKLMSGKLRIPDDVF